MDLKDFVTQTFVQIVQGVEEARKELKSTRAAISPDLIGDYKEIAKHGGPRAVPSAAGRRLSERESALQAIHLARCCS